MSTLKFRRVSPTDSLALALDSFCPTLEDPKSGDERLFFIAQRGTQTLAFVYLLIDKENKLGRIHRMGTLKDKGEEKGSDPFSFELKALLTFAMDHLKTKLSLVDILYGTTRTLTVEDQKLMLELGFHVLGIFPLKTTNRAPHALMAYYFDRTLTLERYSSFALHPKILSLYELIAKRLGLKRLSVVEKIPPYNFSEDTLPILELLDTPHFVDWRFERVSSKKNLSANFYPFQKPNAVIMSPDQKIEVFARLMPQFRFATIIGEYINQPINPVELYAKVLEMLRDRGATFIEVINDAADVSGIECILQAGFLPCGYFPALKKHGAFRRDFVIFALSWENFDDPSITLDDNTTEYLKEYLRLKEERVGSLLCLSQKYP